MRVIDAELFQNGVALHFGKSVKVVREILEPIIDAVRQGDGDGETLLYEGV